MPSEAMLEVIPNTGTCLREMRTARGLSMAEAADTLGCNQKTLHRIETEQRGMSLGLARKLAEMYETTIDKLLSRADAMDPPKKKGGRR